MDGLDNIVAMLDYILDSKRKRHIVGGLLLSTSALFAGLAGLAATVITIREDENDE